MEVHAHTHTAQKKCPPDPRQNWSVGLGAGRDSLFPGVSYVIPCCVLRVLTEYHLEKIYESASSLTFRCIIN